jgi:hypothetical protein
VALPQQDKNNSAGVRLLAVASQRR